MGCKSLNCTVVDVIHANPDIAGGGVLAAFFGSAALTLFAIAYGYFSNSLPERYLTEFDHAIISYVNLEKLEEICFSALFNIKSRTRRALGRKVLSRRPRLSRAQREEVVTRFVLALSDQQLVTGLAILVGTVANQCTLTRYDFNMAFSLAWFSAITHLATLDVLREYLLKHKTVRNWRVFGMVCILGFLIYSLAIMVMRVDDSIPVQCLFDYPRLFGTTGVDYIVLVVLVITIIFLLVNYSRRIQWSIRETNRRLSFSYFLAFGFWKRYGIGKDIASDNVDTFLERLAVHRGFSERRKLLESMKMQDTELGSLHPRLLYSYLYATSLHQGSFIATTTEIMFMISYGITQSISARWTSRGYGSTDHFRKVTVHHDRSMGFGQVTPLLLLILPLFAAAEIYYDASNKKTNSNDHAHDNGHHDGIVAAPSRADTGLVARSGEDQELEQTAKKYDENISLIHKYFDIEPAEIELQSASAQTADDARDVWLEKKKYFSLSQEFDVVQGQLPSPMGIELTRLLTEYGITIFAGVVFNLDLFGLSIVASIFIWLYFVSLVAGFFFTLLDASKALRDESLVARILKLMHKDIRLVDGPSTRASSPATTAASVAPSPPPERISLQNMSASSS